MVKLRLRRTGKKGQPYYRIVAANSRSPRNGRFIEIIGNYNPRTKPPTISLDKQLAEKWLAQGAQPTETVRGILVKEGLLKKAERPENSSKPKKKSPKTANKSKTKSNASK